MGLHNNSSSVTDSSRNHRQTCTDKPCEMEGNYSSPCSSQYNKQDISSYTSEQLAMMYHVFYSCLKNEDDESSSVIASTKYNSHNAPPEPILTNSKRQSKITTTATTKSEKKKPPHKKNKKRKSNAAKGSGGSTTKEIFSGPAPGFPPGWTLKKFERLYGMSKGTVDRYWFSCTGIKFRSMKEVTMFLKCLEIVEGDEEEASRIMKEGIVTFPE